MTRDGKMRTKLRFPNLPSSAVMTHLCIWKNSWLAGYLGQHPSSPRLLALRSEIRGSSSQTAL